MTGGWGTPRPRQPFLITGCGRSGTAWAAALFTALGYPTGHEAVFGVHGPGAFHQSDSSWLAVPYAAQVPSTTPLLRIMRDPHEVIMSALAKGFLADLEDPYARYVRSFRPTITRPTDHLTRVIRWVALWDSPLDDLGHTVLRSDGGLEHQANAVDLATRTLHARGMIADAMVLVGNRVNTSREGEPDPVSREWLATHPDYALIRKRAERFGYL